MDREAVKYLRYLWIPFALLGALIFKLFTDKQGLESQLAAAKTDGEMKENKAAQTAAKKEADEKRAQFDRDYGDYRSVIERAGFRRVEPDDSGEPKT